MEMTRNLFSYQSPDDSTAYLIVRISNLHQRRLNSDLASLSLTFTQYVLLSGIYWLQHNGQEVTQVALVDLVKFDKSTVSGVLKTLIVKGLVTRREHPVDTRAKLLNITAEGVGLLEQAIETVKGVDKAVFGGNTAINDSLNEILLKYSKLF